MLPNEIVKKIRHIEICTRRLLSGSLAGDSRSAVKGSGLEFDQIREYQQGDDIRFVDWNSSSRMNKLLVKQYIEERNRTIILAVDVSASGVYSSSHELRSDIMAQIAGVLALVAEYGKDAVGLLLFSDEIEAYMPPGKGKKHTRAVLEKAFTHISKRKQTNISVALEHLAQLRNNGGIVVLISDFIQVEDERYRKIVRQVAKKYDLIAVRCLDAHEQSLPSCGFVTIEDSETGALCTLDMRSQQGIKLREFLQQRLQDQAGIFKKCGADLLDISIGKPFVGDIIKFFRRRMTY